MFQTSANLTGHSLSSHGVSQSHRLWTIDHILWSHRQGCYLFTNVYVDNEHASWGFKDIEFIRRQKGPATAALTYHTRSRKGMGWVIMNITLGPQSYLRTEMSLHERDPQSCSWYHLQWLLPYLPILRSASNATDLHSAGLTCPAVSSFLTDVKTQCRLLLSKPGYCCFIICISDCSFVPGQTCNISLLFHIHSKVITKKRHVSSAIWARNIT